MEIEGFGCPVVLKTGKGVVPLFQSVSVAKKGYDPFSDDFGVKAGVLVSSVIDHSAAANAGLKASDSGLQASGLEYHMPGAWSLNVSSSGLSGRLSLSRSTRYRDQRGKLSGEDSDERAGHAAVLASAPHLD